MVSSCRTQVVVQVAIVVAVLLNFEAPQITLLSCDFLLQHAGGGVGGYCCYCFFSISKRRNSLYLIFSCRTQVVVEVAIITGIFPCYYCHCIY